jgi:hypothetical protein
LGAAESTSVYQNLPTWNNSIQSTGAQVSVSGLVQGSSSQVVSAVALSGPGAQIEATVKTERTSRPKPQNKAAATKQSNTVIIETAAQTLWRREFGEAAYPRKRTGKALIKSLHNLN